MNTKKSPSHQLDLFDGGRECDEAGEARDTLKIDDPFSEFPAEAPSSGRYNRYSDVRELGPDKKEWHPCEPSEVFPELNEVSRKILEKIECQLSLSDDPVFQMRMPMDLQGLIMTLWQVRHEKAQKTLPRSLYDKKTQDQRIFYRVYGAFHKSYRAPQYRKALSPVQSLRNSLKYNFLLKKFATWLMSREFDLYNEETGRIEHHWRVTNCNLTELAKKYPQLVMTRTEKEGKQKKTVDLIDIFLQLSF